MIVIEVERADQCGGSSGGRGVGGVRGGAAVHVAQQPALVDAAIEAGGDPAGSRAAAERTTRFYAGAARERT